MSTDDGATPVMHEDLRHTWLFVECDGTGIYAPNPYREDLWGDSTPEWMCKCQRNEAVMDV